MDTTTSSCQIILRNTINGIQIEIPLPILITGDVNLLPLHLLSQQQSESHTKSQVLFKLFYYYLTIY